MKICHCYPEKVKVIEIPKSPDAILTIVCCKCHKFLGYKDGEGVTGVSHGYCPKCLETELEKVKEMKLCG
jgi:hypothetical protein